MFIDAVMLQPIVSLFLLASSSAYFILNVSASLKLFEEGGSGIWLHERHQPMHIHLPFDFHEYYSRSVFTAGLVMCLWIAF